MDDFDKFEEEQINQAGNTNAAGPVNPVISQDTQTANTKESKTPAGSKPKNTKPFILLFILFVALIAGLIYFVKPYKTPVKLPPQTQKAVKAVQTAEVAITANGFMPETISVRKGDQVTWINMDTIVHQPITDPHPAHTGMVGFESTPPLAINDSYSLIFENPGIYTYHDESNPLRFKGTIIVK